jgi:hypothetical protein
MRAARATPLISPPPRPRVVRPHHTREYFADGHYAAYATALGGGNLCGTGMYDCAITEPSGALVKVCR